MPIFWSHAIDHTTVFIVKEAFRKIGIYPVERTVIGHSQMVPASIAKKSARKKQIPQQTQQKKKIKTLEQMEEVKA